MNKAELIDAVAQSADLSKASAGRAVDAALAGGAQLWGNGATAANTADGTRAGTGAADGAGLVANGAGWAWDAEASG